MLTDRTVDRLLEDESENQKNEIQCSEEEGIKYRIKSRIATLLSLGQVLDIAYNFLYSI
jgi:hypothetical protein